MFVFISKTYNNIDNYQFVMCKALSTKKYVPCWCLWYYIHCNMILRNSQAGRDYDCNMFVAITLKSAAPLLLKCMYQAGKMNGHVFVC